MIECLLICGTVVFCVIYITHWLQSMSQKQLPHFSIGHLEPKQNVESTDVEKNKIRFEVSDNDGDLSDQALKDEILKDMASTYTAIMRGEFDLDEFGK